MSGENTKRRARTVLEAQIWARQMTFEEFVEYAETFAREHGLTGTLSLRHLHRLASGRPTGTPLPATRRLLEAIFEMPWTLLLANPSVETGAHEQSEADLLSIQARSAQRIDPDLVRLLAAQLDTIRRLDRRLGGTTLIDHVRQHAAHVDELLRYTMNPDIRRSLAAVLTDAHTLAGWQSLDLGHSVAAWNHYRQACEAARAAESPVLLAHAQAEQAVVLADAGETTTATQLAAHARAAAHHTAPALLRSWLTAAHGEALATDSQQSASLRAFDKAAALMPPDPVPEPGSPYVALNETHLARWRGHALARFGHPDAVEVLTAALTRHDPTFVRAETGLRVDLALAYAARGERDEAVIHRNQAGKLARDVGSARQRRRLGRFAV
jgi:tetratricopeptide (TPR) repeat protein